jgi:hypothetical protein
MPSASASRTPGADRFKALLGPVRALAVPLLEQVVERSVEPVVEQTGAQVRGEQRVLDQDWLAARKP